MLESNKIERVISLGSFCMTARLLQTMNLKKESYPFDWIFATPKMAVHCLDDDFATFLNKNFYVSRNKSGGDERQCQHIFYNSDIGAAPIFNHRDPTTDGDYEYYLRCVSRFRAVSASPTTMFLLVHSHGAPEHVENFNLVNAALDRRGSEAALLYISHTPGNERHSSTAKTTGNRALAEMVHVSPVHYGTNFVDTADDELARSIIREFIFKQNNT